MRAISQTRLGGPDVLELTDLARPSPGPTEILVRVHAAGVNPADWKARATGGRLGAPPFVLGWDVSGVVEAVGEGVTRFRPGDEVFGFPQFPHQAGAYAEYLAAPSRHFAPKPASLDHVHAAAVPLAGLTVWQSFTDAAQVGPGQRVLVHAAAGGVGHLAVQVAKALGAYVVGTASAPKHDFVRGLGADEVLDYREGDFGRDMDVVLDTVGGDTGLRSLDALRPGGRIVRLTRDVAPGFDVTAHPFLLAEPDHAGLLALTRLVDQGRLRPVVDTVFPLEDAAKAHELGEAGHTTGKLVLRIR